jgi:hypothetical protein
MLPVCPAFSALAWGRYTGTEPETAGRALRDFWKKHVGVRQQQLGNTNREHLL